nr:MAG TPA: hypothetical protein [Caudoviricetes sp.]
MSLQSNPKSREKWLTRQKLASSGWFKNNKRLINSRLFPFTCSGSEV